MALPKLEVIFQPGHLKLGIRGTNPYLDVNKLIISTKT